MSRPAGFTVRYMRKGLDEMPIDQWYPDDASAQREYDRLLDAYSKDEVNGLKLLCVIDGDAKAIAIEDGYGL